MNHSPSQSPMPARADANESRLPAPAFIDHRSWSQPVINAYSSQEVLRFTRIEMLVELYDAAISSIEAARDAAAAQEGASAEQHMIRAFRLLHGIVGGLNHDAGDIAGEVARLCLFIVQSLNQRQYEPALKVLRTLREAFDGIRDEAVQLEQLGLVPEISAASSVLATA